METVKHFLENSTIHGLRYISTTRKWLKLFWLLVVVAGFTGAGVLIYQSFDAWNKSPVSTTLDTLPIEMITLPKVAVCPPKYTFTNLNYDIITTENLTLDRETRDELTHYALNLILEHHFVIFITVVKIQHLKY